MAVVGAGLGGLTFAAAMKKHCEAAVLEADIVKRGRQHILDSRGNAKRFHATGAWDQAQRNLAFRVANPMIALFSKRA